MIKKSFKPYPAEILPKGFIYPTRYLELADNTATVQSDEYFQWWFEDADNEGSKLAYRFRNDKIEGLNLVPFAQNGDLLANFDGDDHSGNPRVVIVDLGNLPFHLFFDNFDDWLAKAEQDYWR